MLKCCFCNRFDSSPPHWSRCKSLKEVVTKAFPGAVVFRNLCSNIWIMDLLRTAQNPSQASDAFCVLAAVVLLLHSAHRRPGLNKEELLQALARHAGICFNATEGSFKVKQPSQEQSLPAGIES